MNKTTYFDLFRYSLEIGFESISRGIITLESIKRIVCPMDVSRYYELPVIANNLRLKKGSKILDISSPKLLTYYLANKFKKVNLYGIDKYMSELDSWKAIITSPKNLKIEYGDATKLQYPSNSFDEVFSISVIEHLGNKVIRDDVKMMKEVYRVLKKGGRFYLTTIISNKKSIVYKNKRYYDKNINIGRKSFFCRIYDYQDIRKNILGSTKFRLIKEELCGYRYPSYEKLFNSTSPLSAIFMGWLNLVVLPVSIYVQPILIHIPKRAEYFCVLEK